MQPRARKANRLFSAVLRTVIYATNVVGIITSRCWVCQNTSIISTSLLNENQVLHCLHPIIAQHEAHLHLKSEHQVMRTIFISALSLLLSYSTTLGQGFAPIGAEWIFANGCFFPPPSCGYYKVTAVSDTMFYDQTYSVLEFTDLDSTNPVAASIAYVTSVGDSVFTYNPTTEVSNLLYDFSRVTGDTIVVNDPASGNTFSPVTGIAVSDFRVVVDSTNTIIVDGIPLRVQYTSPADTSEYQFLFRIIERIGNVQFLFGTSSVMPLAGYYGTLACYSEPSFHFGQPIETCGLISAIEEQGQIETVTVYPNPTTDFVRFSTSTDTQIDRVEIFDVQGVRVLNLPKLPADGIIELRDLKNGLYIMYVHLPNSIFTTKIMKL